MSTHVMRYKPVITGFLIWIICLSLVGAASAYLPLRTGYLGPLPLANFDGLHYLKIAEEGYFQYGEAFFPLYPLVIRAVAGILPAVPAVYTGIGISLMCFFAALMVLYDELKSSKEDYPDRTVAFLLTYPAAFFFAAVYSESLFLLLTVLAWSLARRGRYLIAGLAGAAASGTRLVGIALIVLLYLEYRRKNKRLIPAQWLSLALIPGGLVAYIAYLYQTTGDALRFFHVQVAFGANRSADMIIFLPQVVWRYLKIIFTAIGQPTPVSYAVSVSELLMTVFAFVLLISGFRMRKSLPGLIYAAIIIFIPTLTGTLSSMPRYIAAAFPLFMVPASYNRNTRYAIVLIFAVLQAVAAALFFRGWFIS